MENLQERIFERNTKMPITKLQIEQRRKYIGASDISAIMGLSQWRTPYDIYLEKTGKLEEETKTSQAADVGNAFERGIISLAVNAGLIGKVLHNQFRILEGTKLASHIDGIVIDTGRPVEAKLRSRDDCWGEENSDAVPDDVILQCQVQLLCTAKDLCNVAAVLASRGFRLQMFYVPFDKELGDKIIEVADNFWTKHVQADIPPENSLPSASFIKRIRREPESIVPISDIAVENWLKAKDAVSQAEKDKELAEATLFAELKTSEAGKYSNGMITYLEQSARRIDTASLKTEMPDIAKQYEKICKYRVLRNKRKKET